MLTGLSCPEKDLRKWHWEFLTVENERVCFHSSDNGVVFEL